MQQHYYAGTLKNLCFVIEQYLSVIQTITIVKDIVIITKYYNTDLSKRERERERERENSNSKTLFYKDCSLGSFKNLSNS